MKCKVCKKRFKPTKEDRYEVAESKSIIGAIATAEKKYDAFDCPHCGVQHLVNVRLERVKEHDQD